MSRRPCSSTRSALIACAALALLLAPAFAGAEESVSANETAQTPVAPEAAEAPALTAPTTVDFGGMMVSIDPATGRIRQPSAADRQKLAQALSARLGAVQSLSARSSTQTELADGTVMAEIGPEHYSYSVARVAEDGSLVTDCAHGEAEAHEIAATPAPAPEREVK